MAISSRHFIRIGIILIGVPLAAQSPGLLPFSLSVTQSWEHPAEMNSTRAVLSSKPLRSALQLDDGELRSWNIRLRLFRRFQVLGGAISVSELPARAKNPAPNLVSPLFRPVTAASGWLLDPGTVQTTTLAAEARGTYWHVATFGNQEDTFTSGSWTYGAITIPDRLPFKTSVRLAVFGGITTRQETTNTAWFNTDPRVPDSPVLFPGAEFALTNRAFTCSITGFRNIPRLAADTGAFRSDAALTLGFLTLAGSIFRSDTGFVEFDGTRTLLRERLLAAPSLLFRIPGTRKTVSRLRFLYARDIRSPEKMNTPMTVQDWYGSRISIENPVVLLQGTAIYKEELLHLSGRWTTYRLVVPWLRIDLEGKAEIPPATPSKYAWRNQTYRLTATVKNTGHKSRFKASSSTEATQKDRYNPICYRIGGQISTTLFSAHTSGKLTLEGYYSTGKPSFEAKISFSGLLQ